MHQVVQPLSGGPVRVVDVPRPVIGPTQVLVQTVASIVSSGTERAVTGLAQSSLLAKARARPDLVRQVVHKARTEGVGAAARTVRARMADDLPLGYSAAGIAIEVGEAVVGVAPGQLVATAGAGYANHAEFQAVPGLLCAPVPDGVSADSAAMATLAAIPLHGLRLAGVGPGSRVVVIGLGLVGQLAVRLAQASGCAVAGIDVAAEPVARAAAAGALALPEEGDATTAAVLNWSRNRGADAVLLTASTPTSDLVRRVPPLCRDRAAVVVVGDVGLDLERTPFYEKELSLFFARSYGPGRYDRSYEEWGVDYPAGHVRWTEGRNLEAVLDLLSSGRLHVADLITDRVPIEQASRAYELIDAASGRFVAVEFTYPAESVAEAIQPIRLKPSTASPAGPGIGLIGAGAFASSVLVPAFREAGLDRFISVASASGLSARSLGTRAGFVRAVSGAEEVIADPEVDVVVIATPHDTHAALAAQALRAGKHVFCEKPLALSEEELDAVEAAWRESGQVLFVGFNRRFSKPVHLVRDHMDGGGRSHPLVITYRVSAGELPKSHWYHDRRQGGRLLGEVCHFIDTCSAIIGAGATEVTALATSRAERLLADDVVVGLAYADGSLASITYASGGHTRTPKERIDVLGGGRTAMIEEFRHLSLDSKTIQLRAQDKGHNALVTAFSHALQATEVSLTEAMIASSRSTIRAVTSLERWQRAGELSD